jgi:pimeloyl-ACP methyl ester carboxylesterase
MTASSKTESFRARDGIEVAFSRSGSGDPLVVFVHATGFCKELAAPVIAETRRIVQSFSAIAIDQRGHGDSATPDPPFDWWDIGRDLVELIDGAQPVIGVGHSAGGAALVLAELESPGTFDFLVLVEPIIVPPPYQRFPDNHMSAGALRRRLRFTSRSAAYDNFVHKAAFAGWDERAMRAYVDGGLREDGNGVVLKCTPEAEAEFFAAATVHGAWDRLGEIEVPVLILAGEHSTTHGEPFLSALTERFPDATAEIVPKTSHFVWMERPDVVGERVAGVIAGLSRVGRNGSTADADEMSGH